MKEKELKEKTKSTDKEIIEVYEDELKKENSFDQFNTNEPLGIDLESEDSFED